MHSPSSRATTRASAVVMRACAMAPALAAAALPSSYIEGQLL